MQRFKFLFIAFLATQISCNFENDLCTKNSIENYYYLGDIHNEYIENIAQNFKEIPISSKSEAANYLNSYHLNFEPQNTSLLEEVRSILSVENYGSDFILNSDLVNVINDQKINFDLALDHNFIDEWEYSLFIEVLSLPKNDYSFYDLRNFLELKRIEWIQQNYCENEGENSAILLAISIKSTEWWIENIEYSEEDYSKIIPAFLIRDAIGAAIGVGTSMYNHIQNGYESNPENNGTTILVAAIANSVGVVGRVTKWVRAWL